jgi:hypothetical protein
MPGSVSTDRLSLVAALSVLLAAAALAACDRTFVSSEPVPEARSYDCDTRGSCGSFRLGAPNTDPRTTPGPSSEEMRRDSPTLR